MARFGHLRAALFSLVCLLALAFTANAQSPSPTPQVLMPSPEQPRPVAGKSSLFVRAISGMNDFHRCPKSPAARKNRNNAPMPTVTSSI
jgi:hypothetical protein